MKQTNLKNMNDECKKLIIDVSQGFIPEQVNLRLQGTFANPFLLSSSFQRIDLFNHIDSQQQSENINRFLEHVDDKKIVFLKTSKIHKNYRVSIYYVISLYPPLSSFISSIKLKYEYYMVDANDIIMIIKDITNINNYIRSEFDFSIFEKRFKNRVLNIYEWVPKSC